MIFIIVDLVKAVNAMSWSVVPLAMLDSCSVTLTYELNENVFVFGVIEKCIKSRRTIRKNKLEYRI